MGTFAYGTSVYGLRAYDLTTGVVQNASAVCAATSTNAATGNRVQSTGGQIDAVSTNSAAGLIVRIAASAISAIASTTSSGEIIRLGSATALPSSTLIFSALRVRESASTVEAQSDGTSTAVYSILVSVSFSGASSSDASVEIVYQSSAAINPILTVTASGRYKYEDIAKDNEMWSNIIPSSPTWTPIDSDSEIWIEVA